jgi:hypothetical protein
MNNIAESVVTVLVVGMTVGIPLLGLTLRFSLKPLVEAWVRLREAQMAPASSSELEMLRARVVHLEHMLELHGMLDRGPVARVTPELPERLPVSRERERV